MGSGIASGAVSAIRGESVMGVASGDASGTDGCTLGVALGVTSEVRTTSGVGPGVDSGVGVILSRLRSRSGCCSGKDAVKVQAVWITTRFSSSASAENVAATSFAVTFDQLRFVLKLIATKALYAMISIIITGLR